MGLALGKPDAAPTRDLAGGLALAKVYAEHETVVVRDFALNCGASSSGQLGTLAGESTRASLVQKHRIGILSETRRNLVAASILSVLHARYEAVGATGLGGLEHREHVRGVVELGTRKLRLVVKVAIGWGTLPKRNVLTEELARTSGVVKVRAPRA